MVIFVGGYGGFKPSVQWIPLKKTTLGQPKMVFLSDWSSYQIGNLYTSTALQNELQMFMQHIQFLDVHVALLATRIINKMHSYAFCTVAKRYNITKKGKLQKKISEKVVFLSGILHLIVILALEKWSFKTIGLLILGLFKQNPL